MSYIKNDLFIVRVSQVFTYKVCVFHEDASQDHMSLGGFTTLSKGIEDISILFVAVVGLD